jgi:hypothetical protein
MKHLRRLFTSCLVASFVFNSSVGLADLNRAPASPPDDSRISLGDLVPPVEGLDPASLVNARTNAAGYAELPTALQIVRDRRNTDTANAPGWVKELRTRTVESYFERANGNDQSAEWRAGLEALRKDAVRLHEYFEQEDQSGLFKNFVKTRLEPFISSLTAKKIKSASRWKRATQPIGQWSVEKLVVTRQISYLGRFPSFVRSTLGLLSGKHLKGASVTAGLIAVSSTIVYSGIHWDVTGPALFATGVVMGSAMKGAFNAGPLAAILNSTTGWFLRPTTEFINVLNARYLGAVEAKINNFYDRLKPKGDVGKGKTMAELAEKNAAPKFASLEEDGINFAGMTEKQQTQNWDKNLRMWVGVAKRFGQLLRDTHHQGRVLTLISPHDEQAATVVAESIDTKLIALGLAEEAVIAPHKMALMMEQGVTREQRRANVIELETLFDRAYKFSRSMWELSVEGNEAKFIEAAHELQEIHTKLTELGFTPRDIRRLKEIQIERAHAMGRLVTAIALNEVRSFSTAEANRNLEKDARRMARAVRRGFGLQQYTENYLPQVQSRMRDMGYEVGEKGAVARTCESLFKPAN